MQVGLEWDTLPPISQTPSGHLHTPVIGARVERICIQSLRYHLWEANQTHQSHHEYQPLPRLPDRHPRHHQHGTAIQARFLPPDRDIPSDVRGSCGCSGAGSQPSRQARQVWLPLFPALTGLSRDQSGWLSSLTGRITEGSRQAFSDGYFTDRDGHPPCRRDADTAGMTPTGSPPEYRHDVVVPWHAGEAC